MKDKIVEILHDTKCRSKFLPLQKVAEKIDHLYSAGEEVSNKCKCGEDSTGWTTVMGCNICGFIRDPAWPEMKLARPTVTEEKIEKVFSKFSNDFIEKDGEEGGLRGNELQMYWEGGTNIRDKIKAAILNLHDPE